MSVTSTTQRASTTSSSINSSSSLKRLSVPPPPLHDKLTIEGRWRTVKLLQSLHPPQDPIQLEKHLFEQCQGDGNLYESGVYRVCTVLHVKRAIIASYSPAQLVVLELQDNKLFGEDAPSTQVKPSDSMPTPKRVECQIKCGRCKSTQVSVEQKQTRGADESMTVFVQCEKCGLRWKM
jgi:DNA-directed RNA polymerase subunit M/transcription elongation factor TFIIS